MRPRIAHLARIATIDGLEPHVGGLDDEAAAARHRIAGVDRQVDDHLLDQAGVHQHAADGGLQAHRQLDVLAEQPAQHGLDARHHGVEVHDPRLQRQLAAKGEQLSGQRRAPLARLGDLLDLAAELHRQAGPAAGLARRRDCTWRSR